MFDRSKKVSLKIWDPNGDQCWSLLTASVGPLALLSKTENFDQTRTDVSADVKSVEIKELGYKWSTTFSMKNLAY